MQFRFAFIAEQDPRKQELEQHLPNVVMTMTLDIAARTVNANNCDVLVHRPISSATAVQIIETPIRHPSRNHTVCKLLEADMNQELPPPSQLTADWAAAQSSVWMCDEEENKPIVRPVEGIQDIVLRKGAHIHPTAPIRNRHPLSLNGARLMREHRDRGGLDDTDLNDVTGTAIELMKLVCTDCHEARAQAEDRILGDYNFLSMMPGRALCSYTRYYSHWHIEISMSQMAEVEAFAMKVSDITPTRRMCGSSLTIDVLSAC